MQVSQSRQKLWKEWHFISQSMMQPAEVTCMVVVTTRITYCSQSKINSFNLFQGPYLQNRDFWESILWSQDQTKAPSCAFINAVMNSHTTVWWNTKTWKKMLPSPHSLHYWTFFQHDNEDIHSPKVKILQWTCISLNLNALEQLWGIL